MKIWLLTIGEPIPQDGKNVRQLRTGQYAKWLAAAGHQVTFVNSTFDHYQRRQRYQKTTTLPVSENYDVVCLFAREYEKTISLSRFLTHIDIARSFKRWLKEEKPEAPDVILASYPIEELCRAAVHYAAPRNIPVVMDCRDFWPDIFVEILPSFARGLAKIAFYPLELNARRTLSRASAIAGMTRSAIDWGRKKSKTPGSDNDILFPFTYDESPGTKSVESKSDPSSRKTTIAFFGTLSHRIGLDLIIRSVALMPEHYRNQLEFKIAGTGVERDKLQQLSEDLGTPFEFLGWLDGEQIQEIMHSSDYGLLPYSSSDFFLTIPNKFSEYLSASLPVISCTDGEVRSFINTYECGVWMEPQEQAISDRLVQLIDGHKPPDMRANAKKAFHEVFRSETVFKRVTSELEALAGVQSL